MKKRAYNVAGTVLLMLALIAADQLLKQYAEKVLLARPEGVPFIPRVLDFFLVYNEGAAFSLLTGRQGFLIAFTGIALILVLVYLFLGKCTDRLEYFGLVLIFSGGVGNLIDRVMNQKVIDYIRLLFIDFPIFNFADICVCVGVGLFALSMILFSSKKEPSKNHEAD